MDGKQLKNSILQWAIQGKLVPQNPKDEPAQKLLERIAASRNAGDSRHSERSEESSKGSNKTSLRGPCKGTKQFKNPPSRIYCENGVWYEQIGNAEPKDISDEIPFEIPENWAWCRLEHVCKDIADIDHKMPPVCENGVPYISPLNFKPNNEIDYDGAKKISVDDFKQLSRKCKPERGDIIFPRYGTIGVIRTVKTDIDFLVSYSCATIKPYKEYMNEGYICFLLQSSLIQKIEIPRYVNKTTQPNVGLQSIKKFLFALPPLAEQKRIVAKLEQVLPLAEEYGAAQEQLDKLNKELPEALKKSILQEAIQGKLVPQNPKDEPASVLLAKIRKEKESLVKQGLLKKSALEEIPIDEDEIPFEIPESWAWCRVNQLTAVLNGDRGKNYPAKSTLSHKGIPFISALNLDGKSIVEDDRLLCLSEEQYNKLGNGKLVKGDIVVCIRGSLGKHGRYPYDRGAIASSLVILRPYLLDDIFADFMMLYLDSSAFFNEIKRFDNGTAQPNLAAESLKQFYIPLPPLAEQKRIIAKLEQLFKVL